MLFVPWDTMVKYSTPCDKHIMLAIYTLDSTKVEINSTVVRLKVEFVFTSIRMRKANENERFHYILMHFRAFLMH